MMIFISEANINELEAKDTMLLWRSLLSRQESFILELTSTLRTLASTTVGPFSSLLHNLEHVPGLILK